MKKKIFAALLLAALLSLLTVSAAGAQPDRAGICCISRDGVLTPMTAEGTVITASDAHAGCSGFYADAVKFDVTCGGLTANSPYILLVLSDDGVPTGDNTVYFNQRNADADGTVRFTGPDAAYPGEMKEDAVYYVYLVGEGRAFQAVDSALASFRYFVPAAMGDVDGDGEFTAADAMAALQMAVGLGDDWTELQRTLANVDGDAHITATDSMLILQRAVGLIEEF